MAWEYEKPEKNNRVIIAAPAVVVFFCRAQNHRAITRHTMAAISQSQAGHDELSDSTIPVTTAVKAATAGNFLIIIVSQSI